MARRTRMSACSSCGWNGQSPAASGGAYCPECGGPVRALSRGERNELRAQEELVAFRLRTLADPPRPAPAEPAGFFAVAAPGPRRPYQILGHGDDPAAARRAAERMLRGARDGEAARRMLTMLMLIKEGDARRILGDGFRAALAAYGAQTVWGMEG